MPDVRFFQFGMGARKKYLYKAGTLRDAVTGAAVAQWDVASEIILPPAYAVYITTTKGCLVHIQEDEHAVWILETNIERSLPGTERPLCLPTFAEQRHAAVLRVLHHEILINVIDGLPVPNYFVYKKPWYRDGAMMAMCLQRTGNLDLVRQWILGLGDPYDRNNAGETEADNLGQALFSISLVSDKNHPLVAEIQKELAKHEVNSTEGRHIRGRSDFAEHPVYQTKWAKYGLRHLGWLIPTRFPRWPTAIRHSSGWTSANNM